MRTSGCSIQQSLTQETSTIIKQAINLARRRGHAQVTPIHVASVMLASHAGLLRAACLKSHSYPFQCKALELCFNVALNRLPTTTPTPIMGPQPHFPTLANALMAAFKRAQAQQRRGSVESQQQPILALKIEAQQLVISILDDPSVSRVMKEAGFSSTHVKSNVEQVVALVESGCHSTTTTTNTTINNNMANQTLSNYMAKKEDVSSVMNSWVRRVEKSSVVLVGECLGSCEGLVRGIKERVERGDDVPIELRNVKFLNCPLVSLQNLSREEIDLKLGEIKWLLRGCMGRGVVLYLGDLKWVAEYWAYYGEQRKHYYCPVEYLVMGLRKLVFGNVENGRRIWLMAIASFNTYIKCKSGNPSLETLLDLHAQTIPAASCLDLSLNLESSMEANKKSSSTRESVYSWTVDDHEDNKMEMQMTCFTTDLWGRSSSSLPSWLQKWKDESREPSANNDQEEAMQMKEVCKKWDLVCGSPLKTTTKQAMKTMNISMTAPSSPTSISSFDTKPTYWPITFEPKLEYQFLPTTNQLSAKPELLSNPNSTPNSASSSEATSDPMLILDTQSQSSFKQNVNIDENSLEALCCALGRKVPWQKNIIPEIATTILKSRSSEKQNRSKSETWMFFLGADEEGKQKLARELAKIIFGSRTSFKSIGVNSLLFSSPRADSTDHDDSRMPCKRGRSDEDDETGLGYMVRFAEAVKENPHRVFYVEDAELINHCVEKRMKKAIESGLIELDEGGEMVKLEDAIVIFSCESFSSASRACSPPTQRQKVEEKDSKDNVVVDVDEASSCLALDLNISTGANDDINVNGYSDARILDLVDKHFFFSRFQML